MGYSERKRISKEVTRRNREEKIRRKRTFKTTCLQENQIWNHKNKILRKYCR